MKLFQYIVVVVSFVSIANAQGSIIRERTGGDLILFEPHYIFSETDSHSVVISYRVRNDFFVFTRSLHSTETLFNATADAITEILDSTGNSIARQIENLSLTAETNVTAELRKNYTQGLMKFRLPAGRYNILFRIEDKESKRTSQDVHRPLIIPSSKLFSHFPLIPVSETNPHSNEYTVFNLGGDVPFSTDFGFLTVLQKTDVQTIQYSITHVFGEDDSERKTIVDTTVQCISFHASQIDFAQKDGKIAATIFQNGIQHIYYIPVKGTQLRQGRYEITVAADDSTTAKTTFATRWLTMPASLTDLDIATYPLQYLLTEDDYSSLRRGSRETRVQKFEDFWKKKDPTPATVMNEMMAEFYRRVDYTISAFRTLKEPNGSLTDRGKIYILFGKPTSMERSLYPNSTPREVWTYESLKKTFVFEDQSKQGNYKLAESK